MATGTIRFQADGIRDRIARWEFSPYYENEGWYRTVCNKRCLMGMDIGKMPVQPPKTDCKEGCFDGD